MDKLSFNAWICNVGGGQKFMTAASISMPTLGRSKLMKSLGYAIALTAAFSFTSSANAALINVVEDADSASYNIPATNDYAELAGKTGTLGAHVFANTDAEL